MRMAESSSSLASSPASGAACDDAHSVIDELIRSALAYHTPARFVELMRFTRRLPHYSPFNCMLLHIQNPNVTYVARPEQWASMGRTIKPGARPLVILAPMRPILFVFDITDTEGKPLPDAVLRELEDPFGAEGVLRPVTWRRIRRMCDRLQIDVRDEVLPAHLAGNVQWGDKPPARYLIRLNVAHDPGPRFATLAHELGHLFCGHIGASVDDFWVSRIGLEGTGQELEAEAVAYLVSSRFGLHSASEKYLSLYLKPDAVLPRFSMEAILTAAGAIEEMANGRLPARERTRRAGDRRNSKAAIDRSIRLLGKPTGSHGPQDSATLRPKITS